MIEINHKSVQDIVREVATIEILPRFRHLGEGDISFKIGDDPVTIADKAAEKALSARLKDLLPGSNVLGEESFAANPGLIDLFKADEPLWIIDPIDGTRHFVRGEQTFGVIISLVKQNQTVAAWLYHPLSDEFISAELGAGAFFKGKRLRVCEPASLSHMTGILCHQTSDFYHSSPLFQDETAPKPHIALPAFASFYDFSCLVTEEPHFGKKEERQWHFRAMFEYCTPWDDAAPILIHAEAGGYTAHHDGSAFTPSSYARGFIAAPSKETWKELREWVGMFGAPPSRT